MKEMELAIAIHGHNAPGLALGVRMGKIAYRLLDTKKHGRGLTGVVETKICLPDALIAVAGTTPGNNNLIIYDIGKLAVTLAIYETRIGYRVSLRSKAAEIDDAADKFMHRKGKLGKEEKDRLADIFLNLDERYLRVEKVKLTLPLTSQKTPIARCGACDELQPNGYMQDGRCRLCLDDGYFERVSTHRKE